LILSLEEKAAELKESRQQEQVALREDHLKRVREGLAPEGAAPSHVADPELFYNWRAKKGRNPLTKEVTVKYLVKHGLPEEKPTTMSREILLDLYSCVMLGMGLSGAQPLGIRKKLPKCYLNPKHTLAGVIERILFNAPALGDIIVSMGESFFLEDKTDTTGPGTWIALPERQQEDLRNKIKSAVMAARPGAAEKFTTPQQQDKAGPTQSGYSLRVRS
jgi:hypothetical protein